MSSSRSERAWVLALSALLSSCSLGTVSRTACDSDSCQLAFGFGSVCGQDGFCRQVEPTARCARTFPEDLFSRGLDHRDTIVIGSLMDGSVTTHQRREAAAELAIRAANETGGLDGRSFGIVYCDIQPNVEIDGATRTEAAVASARYLAEELALPAIFGPSATDDVRQVFEAVRGAGTLVISPSATSDSLSELDPPEPTDAAPGRLWRTAVRDELQARVIAADMEERGVTSVAVIHTTDDYGMGILGTFMEVFGGTVRPIPLATASGIGAATNSAGSGSEPEVLFVASTTPLCVELIKATALTAGFDDKALFLTDSAANVDFVNGTRDAASARWPQIRGTRPRTPSADVYEIFSTDFELAYGADPAAFSYTAQSHDAAWLLLYGVAWAHHQESAISGTTIARGLRRISMGAAHDVGPGSFQAIVAAFARGEGVDIEGASGSLNYDPATEEIASDPATPPIETWVVDDLLP